jgi:hypothetical protein
MHNLINFDSYAVQFTLSKLLEDKSTKKNIIWATNTYEDLGPNYKDTCPIERNIFYQGFTLQPRIAKSFDDQLSRTRGKGEVFTPTWVINQMNNYCDEEWFGRKNVFNIESNNSWNVVEDIIEFPEKKTWKDYVDSKRLEITCGEAPYIVSRYDVSTGEFIKNKKARIGLLDRKLRVVSENTNNKEEWVEWAIRSVQSCYGYEYQGDNLLIARINVLLTFVEYFEERWNSHVEKQVLNTLANVIAWNFWQMDGLEDTVPYGAPYEENKQISFFDFLERNEKTEIEAVPCKIFDWRSKISIRFMDLGSVNDEKI